MFSTLFGCWFETAFATSFVCMVLMISLYFTVFILSSLIKLLISGRCVRSECFLFLRSGGLFRCFWPGCPGKWLAARYCFVISVQCSFTGSTLHSWCKCVSEAILRQPVAILSALLCECCSGWLG